MAITRTNRWAVAIISGSISVAALLAGIAIMQATSDSNTFRACVNKEGKVRLISAPGLTIDDNNRANGPCKKNEKLVVWNAEGPQGPSGDKGDAGGPGSQGPPGPPADTLTISPLDTPVLTSEISLTIGGDGLGLIAFNDAEDGVRDLWVAHCDDTTCTGATTNKVDTTDVAGLFASIATGADGLGLISYFVAAGSTGDLRVAHCDTADCSNATITTLDSNVGPAHSSIAIGGDGFGLISYFDGTTADLKVAHCENVLCTAATTSTLDSAGVVGSHPSIATGVDGLGLIAYQGSTALKVAHCDSSTCTTATITVLDSAGGEDTSVAIGADGLGLVSYVAARALKVAHCANPKCTSATLSRLEPEIVRGTSLAVGPDGMGLIIYQLAPPPIHDVFPPSLKVAHCSISACTSATISSLDTGGVGRGISVTMGDDGFALVAYVGSDGLMVAHCANRLCTP